MIKAGNFLTQKEAISLLGLIQESLSCTKEDELRNLIFNLKTLIPFDYSACLLSSEERDGMVRSYDLVNVSYPAEWLEIYVIRRYHEVDPIVRENFTSFSLQNWDNTYRKYNPPGDFIKTAEDFELKKGYSYGVKSAKKTGGSIFSFSGKHINQEDRTEMILMHLVPHLHQAFVRIFEQKEEARENINLSGREKEVLQWLKEGKSSWDISYILRISERTVNYHVCNIKDKLNVVNRSQAVAVALERRLIDIE